MTLVLPAVGGVLTGRSPIVGSPAEAEAGARTLSRMAEELNNSYFNASQAVSSLNFVTSTSVTKISAGVNNRFLTGAALLSDDLTIASNALSAYSNEIERIHTSARDTVSDVDSYLSQIQGCAGELERAAVTLRFSPQSSVPSHWAQKPSLWPPLTSGAIEDLTPAEVGSRAWATGVWTTQAISWGWAADRIHECQTRWNKLIAERKQAESTLASKLKKTNLGPLLNFGGAPNRVNITRHFTGSTVHPSRWVAHPLLQDVLSGRYTPEQVAQKWKALGLTDEEVEQLPIEVKFVLAKSDGVPFRVQDAASRAALEYALLNPLAAQRMLGLTSDMSLSAFEAQLKSLDAALTEAGKSAGNMPNKPTVQLVGFGSHDGAVTAGISLGNLDNASHVAINVSGMNSNVEGIGNGVGGAQTLFTETRKADPTANPAIVTWIGYRSPNMIEVFAGDRAAAGAVPLASFIDGVNAVRGSSGNSMQSFTVLAHSYGSTTAAEALKISRTRVDSFVTYGSAGLEGDTTVDLLHADNMYSTMAGGDQTAGVGLKGSGRIDPIGIPGVDEFSSGNDNGGKRVTMHSMFAEEGEWSLVNWSKIGYLSAGTESAESMGKIIAGGRP